MSDECWSIVQLQDELVRFEQELVPPGWQRTR